jgi:AraC-like DNA-binding protein
MNKQETTQLDRIEAKLDQALGLLAQEPQRWVPMAEAAAHLGISVSTFKRRLVAGLIPAEVIRDTNAAGERAQRRFDLSQL